MKSTWCKDDKVVMRARGQNGISGVPHWRAESEMRGRKELTRAGAPSLLGRTAENLLTSEIARRQRAAVPISKEDLPELLRTTAIQLKATNRITGRMYNEDTNVSTLVNGFKRRAAEKGVPLVVKKGTRLAKQRADGVTVENIVEYRDKVVRQAQGHRRSIQKQ